VEEEKEEEEEAPGKKMQENLTRTRIKRRV